MNCKYGFKVESSRNHTQCRRVGIIQFIKRTTVEIKDEITRYIIKIKPNLQTELEKCVFNTFEIPVKS